MGQKILCYLDAQTPYGSARLYVRFPSSTAVPEYECAVLNEICCWNGPDKSERLEGDALMLSWEIPKEHLCSVERFIDVWNNRRGWETTTDFTHFLYRGK